MNLLKFTALLGLGGLGLDGFTRYKYCQEENQKNQEREERIKAYRCNVEPGKYTILDYVAYENDSSCCNTTNKKFTCGIKPNQEKEESYKAKLRNRCIDYRNKNKSGLMQLVVYENPPINVSPIELRKYIDDFNQYINKQPDDYIQQVLSVEFDNSLKGHEDVIEKMFEDKI